MIIIPEAIFYHLKGDYREALSRRLITKPKTVNPVANITRNL